MNDNPLSISWHDSAFIPLLNPHNVLDYFSERSNPFYDRTCNNEVLKMQRVNPEQLVNMQGVEYCLLFAQEPILYVIRKQHRHSPTQVTPISNYYIIAGTVYQAPDLGSVFNSRMLSSVSHLQSAFEEARGYAKYHPSKGYWWDFKGTQSTNLGPPPGAKIIPQSNETGSEKKKKPKTKSEKYKEEASSLFQRRRVDTLLDLLTKKFQPKSVQQQAIDDHTIVDTKEVNEITTTTASIKSEKIEESIDRGVKREASNSGVLSNVSEAKRPKI